jgi:hypothetical protein
MTDVWLGHDGLEQKIRVDFGALHHYVVTGWYETTAPDEPTTAELDAQILAAGTPEPETVDYTGWLKADLVAEADARGLDTTGTKDELIARLDGNDVTATEPEEPAEEGGNSAT